MPDNSFVPQEGRIVQAHRLIHTLVDIPCKISFITLYASNVHSCRLALYTEQGQACQHSECVQDCL